MRGTVLTLVAILGIGAPLRADTLRVKARDADVRLYPDKMSPVIGTVQPGTVLEIKARVDDWYAVLLLEDASGFRKYGFVSKTDAEVVDLESPSTAVGASAKSDGAPAEALSGWTPDWGATVADGAFVGFVLPYQQFALRMTPSEPSAPVLHHDGKGNYGFGLTIGKRWPRRSIELSFTRSTHPLNSQRVTVTRGRTSFVPFTGTAAYQRAGVDARRYWLTTRKLQPYFQIGFGVPIMTLTNGANIDGSLRDRTMIGVGMDFGMGVAIPAHPRIVFRTGVAYRFDFFLSEKTTGDRWSESDDISVERGPKVSTGITLTF